MGIRVGIDVGGTFTDLVAFNEGSGEVSLVKVPTTPRDPEVGVIDALSRFLRSTDPREVSLVSHATTLATNALLGQEGLELPLVALLTTEGFRDVLEIGRQRRPELYNLFFRRPRPLAPRRLRFGVRERIDYKGNVLIRLSKQDVERAVTTALQRGAGAIAISFLHSYANPSHEKQAKEIAQKLASRLPVVASHEIDPKYREYERTSTTVVNAALIPVVSGYLKRLEGAFSSLRISAPRYVMQSSGGLASFDEAAKKPASLIESGPAAGIVASAWLGSLLGLERVIGFDMGGTTAKAGVVVNGRPEVTTEYEVGGSIHAGRIVKGSGYTVRFPFVDLAEVSAGGGTVIWADEGGALRVGPISAGADPGPVCYGMGGDKPTVTDANLLLGRLGEELLGGELKLNKTLAEQALAKVGERLGMSAVEVAEAAVRIVNSHMAKVLRVVTVERGHDPRDFAMVAYGGAGPMHAAELAEDLGIAKVVVPQSPGLFSALGLLVTDIRHDLMRSVLKKVGDLDLGWLDAQFSEMAERGAQVLSREGVAPERMAFVRWVEARYEGQSYELAVELPAAPSEVGRDGLRELFHRRHERAYGYSMPDQEVEVVSARVTAIGAMPKPEQRGPPERVSIPEEALKEVRTVFFAERGWAEARVYDRSLLPAGAVVEGPAVIEQYDSTTIVPLGWSAEVDPHGNLRLRR